MALTERDMEIVKLAAKKAAADAKYAPIKAAMLAELK